MRLRSSIANNIISHIEVYDFTREDFVIKFGDEDSNLAEIKFRAKPDYKFQIYEALTGIAGVMQAVSGSADKKIKTQESPGEYKNTQVNTHDSIDACYSAISHWVGRIKEELRATKYSTVSEVEEIIEEICRNVDESVENSESYFSESEIADIQEKLQDLQRRIKELEEKHAFPEENSSKINSAIEASKKNLPSYPRGVWYKTSATKIVTAFKSFLTVQEVRTFLLDAAKKLFLE